MIDICVASTLLSRWSTSARAVAALRPAYVPEPTLDDLTSIANARARQPFERNWMELEIAANANHRDLIAHDA